MSGYTDTAIIGDGNFGQTTSFLQNHLAHRSWQKVREMLTSWFKKLRARWRSGGPRTCVVFRTHDTWRVQTCHSRQALVGENPVILRQRTGFVKESQRRPRHRIIRSLRFYAFAVLAFFLVARSPAQTRAAADDLPHAYYYANFTCRN